MKTVSILQYDREAHQFHPSFVIRTTGYLEDDDCSSAFDELVIQPSQEWMTEYLEWNRFASRLPDNPAEDLSEEDDPSCSLPQFDSLEELHRFNAQGYDLTERLQEELDASSSSTSTNKCKIRVEPFSPLCSNLIVGSISSWWHLKDRNYGFVIPSVQRLPVSDNLKSRLHAFRCHKGMEFWNNLQNNPDTILQQLQQEGYDLQMDLVKELNPSSNPTNQQQQKTAATGCQSVTGISSKETTQKEEEEGQQQQQQQPEGCPTVPNPTTAPTGSTAVPPRVDSIASIGAMLEQSCKLVAAAAAVSTTTNASTTTVPTAAVATAATVLLEAGGGAVSSRAKSGCSWSPAKVVQTRAQ